MRASRLSSAGTQNVSVSIAPVASRPESSSASMSAAVSLFRIITEVLQNSRFLTAKAVRNDKLQMKSARPRRATTRSPTLEQQSLAGFGEPVVEDRNILAILRIGLA